MARWVLIKRNHVDDELFWCLQMGETRKTAITFYDGIEHRYRIKSLQRLMEICDV